MPSGAKKRKAAAAKKKKSSTTQSHQGENNNNNGKLNSPTSQYPSVEKIEDNSSENKSKDNEKPKNFKSTSSSSSGSSDDESNIIDKNVVVLEPVPETISPIVEPVKPVDSLLDEVSQVFDEIHNGKKKDLVVFSETVVKDDCLTSSVVVEPVFEVNAVEKVVSVGEDGCLVLKDDAACSTGIKNVSSEVNGASRVNETDTTGDYGKQAPVASTAVAVQRTTTWKSCCGIFELFSGSER
ncbi:uncharacterized protein LOC143576930 isoform X2 [Bidens hawaiensis]|uniref:uncharacterized protein LOC143576930 isoform X2 n=1 Tax=Bidens hawaiensis TaxID=980011 RepID=UPI0040494A9E